MNDNTKKALKLTALGLGGVAASVLLYKGLSRVLSRRSATPLKGEPALTLIDPLATPETIPAYGIFRDDNGNYLHYSLNYTPLADSSDPTQMSQEDYGRLQSIGLIPEGFPREQIVPVLSHNERNRFFVGYSKPFSISTNRDPLTVITPEWAVSYELDFDSRNTPLEGIDNSVFEDVAMRTLMSEFLLTNRGVEGCHRDLTLNACNLERGAILNLIIERTRRKQERIDSELDASSVIYGPGIKWNGSNAFMSTYEGGLTDAARAHFNDFYSRAFWHMPKFSGNAVGFIHPYSMSSGGTNPIWIKETQPLEHTYLSDHAVLLGKAVFSDIRKTFK